MTQSLLFSLQGDLPTRKLSLPIAMASDQVTGGMVSIGRMDLRIHGLLRSPTVWPLLRRLTSGV